MGLNMKMCKAGQTALLNGRLCGPVARVLSGGPGGLIQERQMSPPTASHPLLGECWEDEGDDAFKSALRSLNKRHAMEMECYYIN